MDGWSHRYRGTSNLTSRAGKALTWHADNTLASVVGPDTVPEGYTYAADGERATRSRNVGQPGGFTTSYAGGLYEEDAPSGDKRVQYRFAGRVVAQRNIVGGAATLRYTYGDRLGSVGALVTNGNISAQRFYTPFGAIRSTNGLPTTRAFTGQRQDGTGLLYYGARYYDPALGRFASADTMGVRQDAPQTLNRYSCVLNNPTKYTDPTGHDENEPWGGCDVGSGSLNCTVTDFDAASWEDRLAWLDAVSARYGLGDWFAVFADILLYFRDSETFQQSAKMSLADAGVIWSLQEGLAASLDIRAAGNAAGQKWQTFFRDHQPLVSAD